MSEEENQDRSENSEDSSTRGSQSKEPGFSFSKSAIADLPSTAVQSIHIENDTPVEVDDEVFVWRDVSPSGTKLPVKTKYKREQYKAATAVKHNAEQDYPDRHEGKDRQVKMIPKGLDRKVVSKIGKVPSKGPQQAQQKQAKVTAHESKNQLQGRRPSHEGKRASQIKTTGVESRPKATSESKMKLVKSRPKDGQAHK